MMRMMVWGLALLVPLPAALARDEKKTDEPATKIEGKLGADDPKDKVHVNSPHKVHEVKMSAGKAYQIDLVSKAFDSFLRLEDSTGKQLAQDDDSGGNLNARITFKAPKDDTYRVIVTNIDGKAGDYTLTVSTPSKAALALGEVTSQLQHAMQEANKAFGQAKTQADKDKVLDSIFEQVSQIVERCAGVAHEFAGTPEARQALQLARQNLGMLERAKSPQIATVLRKLVDKASDKSVQGQAAVSLGHVLRNQYEKAYQDKNAQAPALFQDAEKLLTEMAKRFSADSGLESQFKDALFELQKLSVGKAALEIEAEDLDGKKFKLSDYRGKVVVIDFWGNW